MNLEAPEVKLILRDILEKLKLKGCKIEFFIYYGGKTHNEIGDNFHWNDISIYFKKLGSGYFSVFDLHFKLFTERFKFEPKSYLVLNTIYTNIDNPVQLDIDLLYHKGILPGTVFNLNAPESTIFNFMDDGVDGILAKKLEYHETSYQKIALSIKEYTEKLISIYESYELESKMEEI